MKIKVFGEFIKYKVMDLKNSFKVFMVFQIPVKITLMLIYLLVKYIFIPMRVIPFSTLKIIQ